MKKIIFLTFLSFLFMMYAVVYTPDLGEITSFANEEENIEDEIEEEDKAETKRNTIEDNISNKKQENEERDNLISQFEKEDSEGKKEDSYIDNHDVEEFRRLNENLIRKRILVEKIVREMSIEKSVVENEVDWEKAEIESNLQEEALEKYIEIIKEKDFKNSDKELILMKYFFEYKYDFKLILQKYEKALV